MILTDELKNEIDNMSYSQMLSKWRFTPAGNNLFQGESGDYFAKVLGEKKNDLSIDNQAGISKFVGWK
jgi:hypothetical protein